MKTVGIVAEYNPFHNGHAYHIAEAKRQTGADLALVVMSADFVQRGEPAIADKFTRTKWALDGGADFVFELPEVFSCACAERFASGAVRILAGTGIVDALCFGSESGDIKLLQKAADTEPDSEKLRTALADGMPYPKAMAFASGGPLAPNDILGVEYLRAIKKYAPAMEAHAIKRIGGYDETELSGEYSSAAAIRRALAPTADLQRISERLFDELNSALPGEVLKDVSSMLREGLCPASDERLSEVLLYRLRTMTAEDIALLPEVSEGLENLFARHAAEAGDYRRMLAAVKSKRYTMARLKRICTCALLGVTEELQRAASFDCNYLYARLLGLQTGFRDILGDIAERSTIPLIFRREDRALLPPEAARVLAVTELAHKVHALARPYEKAADEDAEHMLVKA